MKRTTIVAIVIIAVIAIWAVSAYNGLVKADEAVSTAWSNVENQYQRRADLIPNLVNTVKGYAAHENETLMAVTNARSQATAVSVNAEDLTAESLQKYQKAQGEVGAALGRLLAICESYPDLKANENFCELQAQLEGTENRISVERRNFNDAVRSFNTSIRTFPRSLIASMSGFEKRPYYEAAEGTSPAPEVQL